MNKYSSMNQKSWNAIGPVHRDLFFDFYVNKFKRKGYSCLHWREKSYLEQIGIRNKKVIQLCCNNGREALSIKNLGAKEVLGIDFSRDFIRQARELSNVSNIKVDFLTQDVLNIPSKYWNKFDVVYISAGTIEWFQNINHLFLIISKLLKKGGFLFMHEIHPFSHMIKLQNIGFSRKIKFSESYFNRRILSGKNMVTYFPGRYPKLDKQYVFPHTISDIMKDLLSNRFIITDFTEYPEDISGLFQYVEDLDIKFPLSYILVAKKK